MPRSAPTPCRHPACALVLDRPGYCDQHRTQVHRDYGRARRGFDAEVGFYQSVRSLMASSNSPTRGHPKFPQAARSDYDGSVLIAMRAAASLSL